MKRAALTRADRELARLRSALSGTRRRFDGLVRALVDADDDDLLQSRALAELGNHLDRAHSVAGDRLRVALATAHARAARDRSN